MIIEILIIFGAELVLTLIFWFIGMYKRGGFKNFGISLIKGWIERGFVSFGLLMDLPLVLVFFSAIKLGTRFRKDEDSQVSNDQFLVGNLLSVAAAIFYMWLLSR